MKWRRYLSGVSVLVFIAKIWLISIEICCQDWAIFLSAFMSLYALNSRTVQNRSICTDTFSSLSYQKKQYAKHVLLWSSKSCTQILSVAFALRCTTVVTNSQLSIITHYMSFLFLFLGEQNNISSSVSYCTMLESFAFIIQMQKDTH